MMKTPTHSKNERAFTLVEMLVAIAILGILCTILMQILSSVTGVTIGCTKHFDADTQARLVLDRVSYDVAQMIQRADVDYDFPAAASANGNNEMYFFSQSSGYYPSTAVNPPAPTTASTTSALDPRSSVSLVGYRINPATNQMERLSKGLVWSGVTGANSAVYLPQTIVGTWPTLSADTNFQVISEDVFRLQIQFLIQNATTPAQVSSTPNLEGIPAGTTGYFNPKEVMAIVVSLAVLDSTSQKIVPSGGLGIAASKLPSALGAALPMSSWETNIFNLGLPSEAAGQVRFYQRFCFLNHQVLQ